MRKIYSLVLLAAALLVGTNLRAADFTGNTGAALQDAITAIMNGSTTDPVIKLTQDVNLMDKTIWVGTQNLNDAYKSVTLDLNGHNITQNATDTKKIYKMFELTHGELKVINSAATEAELHLTGSGEYNSSVFYVYGSYRSSRWNEAGDALSADSINTRVNGYFTHLEIGDRVKLLIDAQGIGINVNNFGKDYTINGTTLTYQTALNSNDGFAYGIKIDVEGDIEVNGVSGDKSKSYGIKVNGTVQSPNNKVPNITKMNNVDVPYLQNYNTYNQEIGVDNPATHKQDSLDSPFIHVYPSSKIVARKSGDKSTAIYASGYAKWLIEGTCEGKTGVYITSGVVDFSSATIASNAESYQQPTGEGSANGGGSGIVVNSRGGSYSGDMDIVISGDTKVSGTGGYAIEEIVNTPSTTKPNPDYDPEDPSSEETITVKETKVENITINGGTFEGGDKGAIVVAEETKVAAEDDTKKTEVVIYGGNVDGTTQVGETGNINDITPSGYHNTEVTNADGTTTVVISQGAEPATDTENPTTSWAFIAGKSDATNPPSYQWTKIEADEITSGVVTLGELQINSGSENNLQQLTIRRGAALQVNRLIMNAYARIIVEAGAKLIVKGNQGIVAPSVENITLKTSATAQAIFLFDPAVTSNRHPNATIEFISHSYRESSSDLQWQRFGVPAHGSLQTMTCETPGVRTFIYKFDYATDGWLNLGELGVSLDETTLNTPFVGYDMICNQTKANAQATGTKYKMECALYGNENATLPLQFLFTPLANSYMAPIKLSTLLNTLSEKSIYRCTEPNGIGGYIWQPVNFMSYSDAAINAMEIMPMESFILHNGGAVVYNETVNYSQMVYTPAVSPASVAPRMIQSRPVTNVSKMKMIVTDELGYSDNVVMGQSDDFTSEYESGYDAEKYMNDGKNLYVTTDNMFMATYATNELNNTYLGFSALKGGLYTIHFDMLQGEEFVLIDLVNNAQTVINASATYQFNVEDNYSNDYRFKIISRQEMPTEMELVENVKLSANGIYTLTGQYLGEMNLWNELPAGMYIVNGEKRIK